MHASSTPASITRAFQQQYIALILIILTLIIGAFASAKLPKVEVKKIEVAAIDKISIPKQEVTFANLDFSDLFTGLIQLNQERAWALAQVLKSHDIKAKIEIFSPDDLVLGLAKNVRLGQFLSQNLVPAESYQIQVSAATNQLASIHVSFANEDSIQ